MDNIEQKRQNLHSIVERLQPSKENSLVDNDDEYKPYELPTPNPHSPFSLATTGQLSVRTTLPHFPPQFTPMMLQQQRQLQNDQHLSDVDRDRSGHSASGNRDSGAISSQGQRQSDNPLLHLVNHAAGSLQQNTPKLDQDILNDPETLTQMINIVEQINIRYDEFREIQLRTSENNPKYIRKSSSSTEQPTENVQDEADLLRRKKYNDYAKKARASRKAKSKEVEIRCQFLEEECERLWKELAVEKCFGSRKQ